MDEKYHDSFVGGIILHDGQGNSLPIVSMDVKLGEICVFMKNETWSIGKLLQFSKFKNTTVGGRQYKGCSAAVSNNDIGVLCSWFSLVDGFTDVFQICDDKQLPNIVHSYIPISLYLCTITTNCIQCSIQTALASCQF